MKWLVLVPVRFYRRFISPLKPVPTCRYSPTCSQYAIEAVERRGVVIGTLKSIWRLLRCNPLFKGGYDPVIADCDHAPHGEVRKS
jgi:putative membrane protein insertion efficiency factor